MREVGGLTLFGETYSSNNYDLYSENNSVVNKKMEKKRFFPVPPTLTKWHER